MWHWGWIVGANQPSGQRGRNISQSVSLALAVRPESGGPRPERTQTVLEKWANQRIFWIWMDVSAKGQTWRASMPHRHFGFCSKRSEGPVDHLVVWLDLCFRKFTLTSVWRMIGGRQDHWKSLLSWSIYSLGETENNKWQNTVFHPFKALIFFQNFWNRDKLPPIMS